jgi:hypothetical protein
MYHDEKLIDGILHWRGTRNGQWTAYTAEQLSERVLKVESELATLRENAARYIRRGIV